MNTTEFAVVTVTPPRSHDTLAATAPPKKETAVKTRTWFTSISAVLAVALAATGCGVSADDNASGGSD
jgi:putative tricarboxylic transport membrane protein